MSPILVRPVREQLEHDRIIRILHGKSRRKYDAGMNPGVEQNAPVGGGSTTLYPDLVLYSQERGRRLEVVIEVETGESVNHLEALAQWSHFAKLRAAFHLYVPSTMVDVARRLCEDNNITVHEFWAYHGIGDDVRFALIHKSKEVPVLGPPMRRTDEPAQKKVVATPVKKVAVPVKKVAAPAKKKASAPAPARRPAAKAKRAAAPAKKKAAPPRRKTAAPARKKASARPAKRR
ncbi:MAG: hypothetical protein QM736_11785 [Vicinamibacterales bacterium]